jgi:hypothetical protein
MTAVAVRIPNTLEGPATTPRLYVHEGARQALERRLCAALPTPVSLSVTDNTHAIITHRSHRGVVRARIHHMFLDAPQPVVSALIRYVQHGDPEASAVIGSYIEKNHTRLARRPAGDVPLTTKGKHHDLIAIFQRVNEKYFKGEVQALVTWGRRTTEPGRKRHTINSGATRPTIV